MKYSKKQLLEAISYWTKILNESMSKTSYYSMFMQEHPEDEIHSLQNSLVKEFANDLKRNNFSVYDCYLEFINEFKGQTQSAYFNEQQNRRLTEMLDRMTFKYNWGKISSQLYAAIITRNSARLNNAKGKIQETDELEWKDVRRNVSPKVLMRCLNTICHNANVLEANIEICGRNAARIDNQQSYMQINEIYKKNGFKPTPLEENDELEYYFTQCFYNRWASYEKDGKLKSQHGGGYICDSDQGPKQLRKILNECPYDADEDDLVITINKCLDVVHFRGDLASAFIEGGQRTCAMVSNMPSGFVFQ